MLRPARRLVLIALPWTLISVGCAPKPPGPVALLVPAKLRQCAPEPPPPARLTHDALLVDWIEDLRAAGADCRAALAALVGMLPP